MKSKLFFTGQRFRALNSFLALVCCLNLVFTGMPVMVMAAPGETIETPTVPMELPVEVEIELAPAASLKQAPLWKELVQLLKHPYGPDDIPGTADDGTIVRRPSFGQAPLPPLNIWNLDYNFLTAEPLRLRTSDGEISWDQPGPLFDPAEQVPVNAFNVPTALRTIIGELAAEDYQVPGGPLVPGGALVVRNPAVGTYFELDGVTPYIPPSTPDGRIPPDGTIVAVPAFFDNMLHEIVLDADGVWTGDFLALTELEQPVNEEHFFRNPADVQGVPVSLQPYIGRPAAEALGKALFWDMQVGSDGIQACGSCHFAAGVDSRTKGQLNPDVLGGDLTLQVKGPNQDVVANDFPFRKLANPNLPSEGDPAQTVLQDFNDVMSSMGVSRFKLFVDIPVPGPSAFGPAINGVAPLRPDIGTVAPDPVPVNEGLRRVEPRNTPTFHGAAFNFDNFWDGRARFEFNGGSVQGASDPQFQIWVNDRTATGQVHGLPDPFDNTLALNLWAPAPGDDPVPARIKFCSLASQSVGPPLSDFEMSFSGRNWAKIGKKLLQPGVTPLANQLVSSTDSVLGLASNNFITPGKPGLRISYATLIRLAFAPELWANSNQHFNGAPDPADPFDGYSLTPAGGAANPANTNQFTQMEANFSLFFGLAVQAYEELTIPDNTPFDRFIDTNPNAANGIGQPGEQAVLFPTLIPGLVGPLTLIPDDPATLEYDGFGPDELFGFDIFAGGNLTAALDPDNGQAVDPVSGINRNPKFTITTEGGDSLTVAVGSNPFTRSARCMLCHLGPEQTDHSINISHGLLKGDAEFEFPTPPSVPDPSTPSIFLTGLLPAPEAPGPAKSVGGLILAEEIEGAAQDSVEVEPRNFATFNNPLTPWDDRVVAQPGFFAFGDQGIYNVGVRPIADDIGRGGLDAFGWPLSLSTMALKNIGGIGFVPGTPMPGFDPLDPGATFEETGEGLEFPGAAGYTLQSINPGFEKDPIVPQLPPYLAKWAHGLPAGELHPQIDELGFSPNTTTQPNGGPALEFAEVMFGADLHSGVYNPAVFGDPNLSPNFGWGPRSPNNQSGVPGNYDTVLHGTWPVPNRVLADGAFKAPSLRNIEMTGPYFHTGSFLTLRQVVDFYIRGGDFPLTNTESRDPHILNIVSQAFGFGHGKVLGPDGILGTPDDLGIVNVTVNGVTYNGNLGDALPDTVYQYDPMPDVDHPLTPEYATPEEAKVALVKFLLSLTDPRVKYERAPFDRPEIFVPIDGRAPESSVGRVNLIALANASPSAPVTFPGPDGILGTADDIIVTQPLFKQVTEVGAAGNTTPLPNFLGVSSVQGFPGVDHFDSEVFGFPPVATNLTVAAVEDTPVTIDLGLLVTDPEGNPLTFSIVTQPANGTLAGPFSPSVIYTPALNFNGTDSFTFQANDGASNSNIATVTINVAAVNDAPVGVPDTASTRPGIAVSINVLANDTDVDNTNAQLTVTNLVNPAPVNGTLTLIGGRTVRYRPNAGFSGIDTFTYTANDGSLNSNVATVTVIVTNPPIARSDIAIVNRNNSVVINVVANDTDTDGTIVPSSVTIVTPPSVGTAVNNGDGTITYTATNTIGTVTFSYTVKDNLGATSNTATIFVSVR